MNDYVKKKTWLLQVSNPVTDKSLRVDKKAEDELCTYLPNVVSMIVMALVFQPTQMNFKIFFHSLMQLLPPSLNLLKIFELKLLVGRVL